MNELTLINNEGANLKIRRYQYTLNKGFDIIDQWGVVCKNMNMEEVMDQIPEDVWGAEPNKTPASEPRKFKPLQIHRLPSGPNSVFTLAGSMSF